LSTVPYPARELLGMHKAELGTIIPVGIFFIIK
jgi:hypothetical protein